MVSLRAIILVSVVVIFITFLQDWFLTDYGISDHKSAGIGEKERITSGSFYSIWNTLWLDRIAGDGERTWNTTQQHMDMTIEHLHRIAEKSHRATLRRNISEEINDLFETFKPPSRNSSISLYNEAAYNELISNLLQCHMEGRNFTIVASGGSTTAGATDSQSLQKERRYYGKLAEYLNCFLPSERSDPTVLSMAQGHGSRKSFHTAIFFESFIPVNTDLLLWEFAINDAQNRDRNHLSSLRRCQLNLLSWLYEVGKRKQPPKVILVYYWNTPYTTRNEFEIVSNAFEALGDIGRQFDFVIGHINMAAYIQEYQYRKCKEWETCPFLADRHHANEIGHMATAFLLLNLIHPNKQFLLPSERNRTHSDLYKHEWVCGLETPEKQILQQVITNSSTGWKSPLGAWTLELPVSEDYSSSRRLIAGQSRMDIKFIGEQDPLRQDRQRCTPVAYCGSNASDIFSVVAPQEPMKDVRIMLLNFEPRSVSNSSDISIYINNGSTITNGIFVPVRAPHVKTWGCPFGHSWSVFADTYWYIFEESISVVYSLSLCTLSKMELPPMIQSVALW